MTFSPDVTLDIWASYLSLSDVTTQLTKKNELIHILVDVNEDLVLLEQLAHVA